MHYVQYYWTFPNHDWFCLNMDRVSKQDGNISGCEGIFRDSVGNWKCYWVETVEKNKIIACSRLGGSY